jgi:hypothetical protein
MFKTLSSKAINGVDSSEDSDVDVEKHSSSKRARRLSVTADDKGAESSVAKDKPRRSTRVVTGGTF